MDYEFTLKQYAVEDLKAGMVVGRSVYDDMRQELIAEGTTLTNQLIMSLLDRPIYSLVIQEWKEEIVAIDKHVLDKGFVDEYSNVIFTLSYMFDNVRKTGIVDIENVQRLVDQYVLPMADGLKAITHVHNILREDDYLMHHSVNVAILAGVFGQWMKMTPAEVKELVIAGLIHDIGKTQIPLEILEKPGRLSDDEMKIMKQHSSKGFELIRYSQLRNNKNILFGVLQHHERMDGSGYPAGIKGDSINKFARILAIADVYDAMAANKVYAKQKSPFTIFVELADQMVKCLDTSYCVLFIKNICHSLNGNWVELTNGQKAKIVYIDESRISSLPVVQCDTGQFIDLNTSSIEITRLLTNDEVVG